MEVQHRLRGVAAIPPGRPRWYCLLALACLACQPASVRRQPTTALAVPPGGNDAGLSLPGGDAPAGQGQCGNGVLEVPEGCDDGNAKAGDGCGNCRLEAGFLCPAAGKPCREALACGDRRVVGNEACDDGNQSADDGCTPSCQLEPGWACPLGSVCRAARCGDGQRVGHEQCDDGNTQPGDGCAACLIESPPPNQGDGWICPASGGACTRSTCGDKQREGSEQCDDGNNDLGDGCTPFCRQEPACPATGGACSSACGDGLLLPSDVAAGQECDDGNTRAGDGCAADCKTEPGYACVAAPVAENPLLLPIVYRDFKAFNEPDGHPDFERFEGQGEPGVVEAMLDAQGKPKHVPMPRNFTVNRDPGVPDVDYFAQWYRDDAKFNRPVRDVLPLTSAAGGAYLYDNRDFFPVDGRGFGNYLVRPDHAGVIRNFHFTSEIRTFFQYQGNERLDFTGDDDVWVFINKRLVVDLGGVHQELAAGITLHASDGSAAVCDLLSPCPAQRRVDLGLERGRVYEIAVFQAERRTVHSHYRLTLANFSGPRSRCQNVCGDGIVTAEEACDLGTNANQGGYGTCNADCTLPPRCGDGVVQAGEGETCDGQPDCPANCKTQNID